MSIFSRLFTAIGTFISNLFAGAKKDYLNLEPVIKNDIDGVIKFGNVVKGYIVNPSTAGPVAGELITLAENSVGTGITSAVTAVIGEVVVDLGISKTALTDPIEAYQLLLNHLSSLKGKPLADGLFTAIDNITGRVLSIAGTVIGNNELKALIAFVYDTFFSSATPIITISSPSVDVTNPTSPVSIDAPAASTNATPIAATA